MSDVVDHGGDSCRKWYAERTVEPDFPELEAYLRVGSRVLEVGCGPGTITLDVARRVAPGQVVGVDIASASVEEANARARNSGIDNVRFELADTVDLPYEADSFDLVYSNQVLMYVKDPVRALQEQRRVARRGGRELSHKATTGQAGSSFRHVLTPRSSLHHLHKSRIRAASLSSRTSCLPEGHTECLSKRDSASSN